MMFKRLFDIVVATAGLLLLAPVFLAAALLIALDTRGPVLHKARRIGWRGRPFDLYTFRTRPIKTNELSSVTRAGLLLHRFHLGGLPQLINVLKGELSLIGPHPEAPEYVRLDQPIWRQILAVRPGIFGLAQLSFAFDEIALLDNQATHHRDYMGRILPVKLHLDARYVVNWSLSLDLKLLVQTGLLLIRQERSVPVV